MRIEIFVVETELKAMNKTQLGKEARKEAYFQLLRCKIDLVKLFKGLTEYEFTKGYYVNEKGKIDADFGKIWLIYANEYNTATILGLEQILRRIKRITQQKVQTYAVNTEIRHV